MLPTEKGRPTRIDAALGALVACRRALRPRPAAGVESHAAADRPAGAVSRPGGRTAWQEEVMLIG